MRVQRGSGGDTPATVVPVDTLAEESRLLRSVILLILYEQGLNWLAERVLSRLLGAEGLDMSGGRLGLHLGYLVREGLVETERREIARAQFNFFRITPRGVDVHEGVAAHPGVGARPAE